MAGTCDAPIIGRVCEGAKDAVGSAVQSGFAELAQQLREGLGHLLKVMTTFWLQTPLPNVSATSGPVAQLQGNLSWIVGAVGVVGLLIGAGRLAMTQRAQAGGQILAGLMRMVGATTLAVPAIGLLAEGADMFASWIIQQPSNGDLGASLTELISLQAISGMGPGVLFIAAFIGVVSAFIQAVLLVFRGGVLILLAAVLPVLAAWSFTGTGKQSFDRAVAWIGAFLLYKPVAAVVYAAAFYTISADDVVSEVTGIALLVLAIAALPALMRLLTPAVARATSASGGLGGAAAVGGAAATGAVALAGGGAMGAAASRSAGAGSAGKAGLASTTGSTGRGGGSGPPPGGGQGPSGGPSSGPSGGPAGGGPGGGQQGGSSSGGSGQDPESGSAGLVGEASSEPGSAAGSGQDQDGGARGSSSPPGGGGSSMSPSGWGSGDAQQGQAGLGSTTGSTGGGGGSSSGGGLGDAGPAAAGPAAGGAPAGMGAARAGGAGAAGLSRPPGGGGQSAHRVQRGLDDIGGQEPEGARDDYRQQ